MAKGPSFHQNILNLRARYYVAIPGKESLLGIIRSAEIPEHVYNSNAIENSTLTLDETERILLEIELDRYISQRELFEAKNLARVITYINEKAKTTKLTRLSLEVILLLHKMLLSNIRDEIAGRFRNEHEWVRVGNHIAPDPKVVLPKLEKMFLDYEADATSTIVHKVAKFHLVFESIHPFVDGNGRIGRVLIDYILLSEGYVPINIKFVNRKNYYLAFEEFNSAGKTIGMESIVGLALTNSYHKRLAYLDGKGIITLNEYAKRHKITVNNLINKAKRQTIPAFTEKNIWKIGA